MNRNKLRERNLLITPENVGRIRNWGERIFARACLEKGGLVIYYQVEVGESVIDFRVVNLHRNGNGRGADNGHGKLVEVTCTAREKALGQRRKRRQIRRMESSGYPYTTLFGEELSRLGDRQR